MNDLADWLIGVILSSGLVGALALLMREALAVYFGKAIEHRLEKKLEDFKAAIRVNEQELDQMRSFLLSAKRDRDTLIQAKRLEAAELLLKARGALSQFTMLAEYLKILNIEKIMDEGNDPKIQQFVGVLTEPFKIDENLKVFGAVDKTLPRLYLGEHSLKAYEAYEAVIFHAVMLIKLLSVPLSGKSVVLRKGYIGNKVIEVVPTSKSGFDKWGDSYAFQWTSYLHDEILRRLRAEISGRADAQRDVQSIQDAVVASRKAQAEIKEMVKSLGLSDDLIKPQSAAVSDDAVEAAEQAETEQFLP
jgi:hypothetical protein